MAIYEIRVSKRSIYSPFIKRNGYGDQIDFERRLSVGFGLKSEILKGRFPVLAKTDCPEWHYKEGGRHTSYFYNPHMAFSRKLRKLGIAKPVKEWCLTTYKFSVDSLETLTQQGLVTV